MNACKCLLAGWLLLAAPGCASLLMAPWNAKKVITADAKHPAVEVLAIWQPGEGPGRNGVPVRGVSGQVLFFTANSQEPVKVDGTVRVYMFDNRGTPEEQSKPIHQFDFEPGAWATHLQGSSLGAGYNIFLPYPRKDLAQASCTLRLRFTPTAPGPALYSQMATVVLPGPASAEKANNVHVVKSAAPADEIAEEPGIEKLKQELQQLRAKNSTADVRKPVTPATEVELPPNRLTTTRSTQPSASIALKPHDPEK